MPMPTPTPPPVDFDDFNLQLGAFTIQNAQPPVDHPKEIKEIKQEVECITTWPTSPTMPQQQQQKQQQQLPPPNSAPTDDCRNDTADKHSEQGGLRTIDETTSSVEPLKKSTKMRKCVTTVTKKFRRKSSRQKNNKIKQLSSIQEHEIQSKGKGGCDESIQNRVNTEFEELNGILEANSMISFGDIEHYASFMHDEYLSGKVVAPQRSQITHGSILSNGTFGTSSFYLPSGEFENTHIQMEDTTLLDDLAITFQEALDDDYKSVEIGLQFPDTCHVTLAGYATDTLAEMPDIMPKLFSAIKKSTIKSIKPLYYRKPKITYNVHQAPIKKRPEFKYE